MPWQCLRGFQGLGLSRFQTQRRHRESTMRLVDEWVGHLTDVKSSLPVRAADRGNHWRWSARGILQVVFPKIVIVLLGEKTRLSQCFISWKVELVEIPRKDARVSAAAMSFWSRPPSTIVEKPHSQSIWSRSTTESSSALEWDGHSVRAE